MRGQVRQASAAAIEHQAAAEISGRQRPLRVSVVLPVRNGEDHIAEQLTALSEQTYRGAWELIVVDNGCSDRSIKIVELFRARLPAVVVVQSSRRGLGRARNAGADAASGDLLAFCDADDVAAPNWLEALADGAADADIVGGSHDFKPLNGELQRRWDPTEPMTGLFSGYDFLSYASGGNCAIWTEVARQLRWDDQFRFGSSDIEFAWRAQLAGFNVAFQPNAVMRIRLRSRPTAVARQYFRYGKSEPYLFRRFQRLGMPRSDTGEALATWAWLALNAVQLLRTAEGRGRWLRIAGSKSGRLYGSVRWLVLFL
jgi:glycosyltransferase involved in cell wall biosynthesis